MRKDLTYCGEVGTGGLGYDVEQLSEMITKRLGTKSRQPAVIVGVGNLGRALLSYRGFEQEGFGLIGAFDIQPGRYLLGETSIDEQPAKTADKVKLSEWLKAEKIQLQVRPMEELPKVIADHVVKLAILRVPPSAAQEVANHLVERGAAAILNFAPIVFSALAAVPVNNVTPAM